MNFETCYLQASKIVQSYRDECPINFDPKNVYATATVLAVAAIASSLAGAGVSAYGAIAQGQASADAAKYNAAVAANNETAATQQAQFDAQQIRDKNKRELASQRAAFGANGIDPDSGTAIDVRSDSAQQGEMQALMAIYTGKTSATAYNASGRLDRMSAANATAAGGIAAGGSLLGGVSSAATLATNPNFSWNKN